ncbi:collagen binding domain-containing protein [Nocardia sp. NPDC057668]|uniref:MSCRAMM family protein n=1 Tax=Nocardia sp. NPDC057668 TaxID=3346202 RepID=UPI00366C65F4
MDGPSISGSVRRDDQHPVPGAILTLISHRGRQVSRTTAGDTGGYTLVPPAPGNYVLIVSADGHQPAAMDVVVADGGATRFDLTLTGTSEVFGVVRTTAQQPVPHATVSVTDALGEVVCTALTAADGSYTCRGVLAGTYTLVTVAPGMKPTATTFTVPDSTRLRVDVAALAPMAVLSGTVRANGNTVRDARVTVLNRSGVPVGTTHTDEQGRYEVPDLPAGDYTVEVRGYSLVIDEVIVDGQGADHDLRLGFEEYAGAR